MASKIMELKFSNSIDRNENEKSILISIKVKRGMQNGDKICMKRNQLFISPLILDLCGLQKHLTILCCFMYL